MAILLPHVMKFNKEKMASSYASLAPLFGQTFNANMSDQVKSDFVISKIEALREQLNVLTSLPISLTQTGKYDKLKARDVTIGATNDGAMLLNPVAMNVNDVLRILIEAE